MTESGDSRRRVLPAFEPMVGLATGRVVGFHGRARGPGPAYVDDPVAAIDADVEHAIGVARAAGTSTVPVHVPVRADTVAAAAHRLRALWPAMLHGQGRGAGTVLRVGTVDRTASPARLAAGVEQARRDGHLVALPADAVAPAELEHIGPDLVVLDPRLTARLSGPVTDTLALAVLRTAGELCTAAGTTLAAGDVGDDRTLALLRGHGVTVAWGPVLAAPQADATAAAVTVAPGLGRRLHDTAPCAATSPSTPPGGHVARTLTSLARPATTLRADATGEEVRAVLADAPESAGVVLVDDGRPVGYLDRDRFLMAIAGPYGRAVYAGRPALRLADPPRLRAVDDGITGTLRAALAGDPRRRWDDVVLTDPDGRVRGAVRFADLVADLDERLVDQGRGDVPGAPGGGPAPGDAGPHDDDRPAGPRPFVVLRPTRSSRSAPHGAA